MTVTSCSFSSSSRARFQPTLPAPTTMMYISVPSLDGPALGALAHGALEHVDRDPGRADGVQALALVPLGAQRVEDAGDHGRHLVAFLGDLGDDDVGVVAVGGGDERVGVLDPGRLQGLRLEAGADGE